MPEQPDTPDLNLPPPPGLRLLDEVLARASMVAEQEGAGVTAVVIHAAQDELTKIIESYAEHERTIEMRLVELAQRNQVLEEAIGDPSVTVPEQPDAPYRLWVNDDRTVLVRFWRSGVIQVCLRPDPDAIWGPPIRMREEDV